MAHFYVNKKWFCTRLLDPTYRNVTIHFFNIGIIDFQFVCCHPDVNKLCYQSYIIFLALTNSYIHQH